MPRIPRTLRDSVRSSPLILFSLHQCQELVYVNADAGRYLRSKVGVLKGDKRGFECCHQGESWHLAFSVSPQIQQSLPLDAS